jgi:aldose 1-epimerase
MVAPSGEQYEIHAGGYRAVVTQCGAGLRELAYGDRPLVQGFPEVEMASAGRGQLLLPWPNRIRDGRYSFGGRDLQLPVTEVSRHNASHGLVRWAAWCLLDSTARSVTLGYRLMAQSGYPWTIDLVTEYALDADGLSVTVTARNRSAEPAPYAHGAHPYLVAGSAPVDEWQLDLPGATSLEVDDRKIPTGRRTVDGTPHDFRAARALDGVELDTAFTDLSRDADDRVVVTLTAGRTGVALWMDGAHKWVQVYTGDDLPAQARTAVAVEPMSSPPNAFATGEDLVVLAAEGQDGDMHSARWGLAQLGGT